MYSNRCAASSITIAMFSVSCRLQTFSKFLTAMEIYVKPLLGSDPFWSWHIAQSSLPSVT
jgi:hypothetical protein